MHTQDAGCRLGRTTGTAQELNCNQPPSPPIPTTYSRPYAVFLVSPARKSSYLVFRGELCHVEGPWCAGLHLASAKCVSSGRKAPQSGPKMMACIRSIVVQTTSKATVSPDEMQISPAARPASLPESLTETRANSTCPAVCVTCHCLTEACRRITATSLT